MILFPIFQLGCFKASTGFTSLNLCKSKVRKGPPLPVRIIRSTSSNVSPVRHCHIAECSLSTGKIFAPDTDFSRSIISPAITKLSLLLRATSTPDFTAFKVGSIPEDPTKPFTIISTSSRLANSNSPSLPVRTVTPTSFNSLLIKSTASASIITTYSGRYFFACSTNSFPFLFALNPKTLYSSPKLSITFNVLVPMDPVEPSIEIFFIIIILQQ